MKEVRTMPNLFFRFLVPVRSLDTLRIVCMPLASHKLHALKLYICSKPSFEGACGTRPFGRLHAKFAKAISRVEKGAYAPFFMIHETHLCLMYHCSPRRKPLLRTSCRRRVSNTCHKSRPCSMQFDPSNIFLAKVCHVPSRCQ